MSLTTWQLPKLAGYKEVRSLMITANKKALCRALGLIGLLCFSSCRIVWASDEEWVKRAEEFQKKAEFIRISSASLRESHPHDVYITKEAAEYLVDCNVKVVGIDYLSVEKFGSKCADTHHTLLRNGIVVIEGLDLSNVKAGNYELIALPLKIKDGDGSPARVILRKTP